MLSTNLRIVLITRHQTLKIHFFCFLGMEGESSSVQEDIFLTLMILVTIQTAVRPQLFLIMVYNCGYSLDMPGDQSDLALGKKWPCLCWSLYGFFAWSGPTALVGEYVTGATIQKAFVAVQSLRHFYLIPL